MAKKFDYVILDIVESAVNNVRARPLNLGAIAGSGGGIGGPPGGFIGQLPQTRVAYDTDEFATLDTSVSGSLLDNLNHIRARLQNVEVSGILVVDDWDGSPTINPTNHITFSGAIVTQLSPGHALIVVSGGSGSALTVKESDNTPTVTNVDTIIISGASVSDMGSGDVLITISSGITQADADTRYQPLDTELTALAGLSSAADKLPYFTDPGVAALTNFKALARTLLADNDAANWRLNLGLGSVSTLSSSIDGTLAGNSDSFVSTQKAVKTYVDTSVLSLLEYKGSTDCSANPNYPAANIGDSYLVSVAGKIGGASGKSVRVGDIYLAIANNAGGTEASVGTSWTLISCSPITENSLSFSDVTTANASTTAHGLVLKATAPAANILNVVGIANGETVYANKSIFDSTNPAALGTAAPGTSLIAAHRDHVHALTHYSTALFSFGELGTIPAGATRYLIFGASGLFTGGSSTPPLDGTWKNFRITIESSQPATGTLVVTVKVGGSSTGITKTIAAGSGVGVYDDLVHTYAYTAGSYTQVEIVNNASSASAQIGACSMESLQAAVA